MAEKKSKMFPVKPTDEQVKYWADQIHFEGKSINDVPDEIRTYIAIMLGV